MMLHLGIVLIGALAFVDSLRMRDGKVWTTKNLDVKIPGSYCYDGRDVNCRRYGRLYTWESARRGCQALGDGWRLPTTDDWRELAAHYGGLRDESADMGKAAFTALSSPGASGFNALFGGGRSPDGEYARLEAHGLFWTASESGAQTAWAYNFGKGGQSVARHRDLQKTWAFSVRCVSDRTPGPVQRLVASSSRIDIQWRPGYR